MESQNESGGFCGRQKATAEMRVTARLLEQEAADWRALADALDLIECHARASAGAGEESGPHVGAGSQAEALLWRLATRRRAGS